MTNKKLETRDSSTFRGRWAFGFSGKLLEAEYNVSLRARFAPFEKEFIFPSPGGGGREEGGGDHRQLGTTLQIDPSACFYSSHA